MSTGARASDETADQHVVVFTHECARAQVTEPWIGSSVDVVNLDEANALLSVLTAEDGGVGARIQSADDRRFAIVPRRQSGSLNRRWSAD